MHSVLKSWGNYSSEWNLHWPFRCGHSAPGTCRHKTLGTWGLQHDCLLAFVRVPLCLEHSFFHEEEAIVSTPNKNVLNDIEMPQSPSLREILKEANVSYPSLQSTYKVSLPGQDILIPKMAHNRNFISPQGIPSMITAVGSYFVDSIGQFSHYYNKSQQLLAVPRLYM